MEALNAKADAEAVVGLQQFVDLAASVKTKARAWASASRFPLPPSG